MNAKHFKALNFDLDTEKLKEAYSVKKYTKAYGEIRKFLKANGFNHRQGSGYNSKEKITTPQLMDILENLFEKYPKIKACVKKLDATNVGTDYDMLSMLEESEYAFSHAEAARQSPSVTKSLSEWKSDIEAVKVGRDADTGGADTMTKSLTEKER